MKCKRKRERRPREERLTSAGLAQRTYELACGIKISGSNVSSVAPVDLYNHLLTMENGEQYMMHVTPGTPWDMSVSVSKTKGNEVQP